MSRGAAKRELPEAGARYGPRGVPSRRSILNRATSVMIDWGGQAR